MDDSLSNSKNPLWCRADTGMLAGMAASLLITQHRLPSMQVAQYLGAIFSVACACCLQLAPPGLQAVQVTLHGIDAEGQLSGPLLQLQQAGPPASCE
jgi:hypothetical protein